MSTEPQIVLFLNPPQTHLLDHLDGLTDDNVVVTTDRSRSDYTILIGGRPSREQLAQSDRLRAVIIPWAGITDELREMAPDLAQISVHNSHYNSRPVAEFALALALAAAKRLPLLDRRLREHDWGPRYSGGGLLLHDSRLLILGYGSIGRALGRMALAIGMEVCATRRSCEEPTVCDGVKLFPASSLRDLLPRADFVVCCLPLTDETRGLIGERELALLPQHAIIVNIGRGPIIDQQALFEALQQGTIGGAGLDVWYSYPADKGARSATAPAEWPFAELDNVVMTPHAASNLRADVGDRLLMQSLAQMLNAAARGESMPNKVDLTLGY